MSAFRGEPFPGMEVLSGKQQTASPGFEKTVLFGKCACDLNKDHPNIKKAIGVKGCPPRLEEYVKYRHYLYDRYKGKAGFEPGMFEEQEI